MTNRLTSLQLWDRIAASADEDVLRTADGELLGEADAGGRVDEIRRIVHDAVAGVPERQESRQPMIPRDPCAKRELLRLLMSGRYQGGQVSVSFASEDDLPDAGVDAELKRLLGRD